MFYLKLATVYESNFTLATVGICDGVRFVQFAYRCRSQSERTVDGQIISGVRLFVSQMNADARRISILAQELEAELKLTRLVTKQDLDAMEQRLTKLIKGPALDALVDAGAKLAVETDALQNAVNQNQPPKKEQNT